MNNLKITSTGSHDFMNSFKYVTLNVGDFSVVIKLTDEGKFVDVVEVGEKKDFLTTEQKLSIKGYHDFSEYYPDLPK